MIHNQKNFDADLPAGYDGKFEWDIFKNSGCWGNADDKKDLMDFDGVAERKLHYLVLETKDEGKAVPLGQEITLNNLHRAKDFTVAKIWPKKPPFKKCELIHPDGKVQIILGHDDIIAAITAWRINAETGCVPAAPTEDKLTDCTVYKDGSVFKKMYQKQNAKLFRKMTYGK